MFPSRFPSQDLAVAVPFRFASIRFIIDVMHSVVPRRNHALGRLIRPLLYLDPISCSPVEVVQTARPAPEADAPVLGDE